MITTQLHLRVSLCLVAVLVSMTAYAHHSRSAIFTDEQIEVTGVVTRFLYRNPHAMIYLNVTDENGEVTGWRSEGGAANLLRGRGWTEDEIQPGDRVRISGSASRNGSPSISMGVVAILDYADDSILRIAGEAGAAATAEQAAVVARMPLTLPDGRPNLSGAWTQNPLSGGGAAGMGMGGGNTGMGMGGGMGGASPAFNEVAAALQAAYDPVNDPAVYCEPVGLVRQAGFTPHPVRIQQEADHVVISYEEYSSVREIMLDGERPAPGGLSRFGDPYAYYDGDALVIETINLIGNLTTPNGNELSDQTSTIETYRRSDDPARGAALTMQTVVTDPGHLLEPWILSWTKWYREDYEFIPNACQPPLQAAGG